jgi:hypothetical protein
MMQTETSRLINIESRKNVIFDEIVRQVARQNDVPMMAAAWDSVLEEIELEVESLLMRPTPMTGQPTPEVEAMIAMWRMLENEARAIRAASDWKMGIPMAV